MGESFQKGDRVKRVDAQGPQGTVQQVRVESIRSTMKHETSEPPGVTVTVLWDNGTLSHFVPEGLQKL